MSALAIHGGTPVRTKKFPAYKVIGEEEKRVVARVLDSGVLSKYLGCWDPDFFGGLEVQAFEREWASYFGVKHAIAVNSATSGLQAAIGAAGIGPGDEVIVSPFTMCASASAPLIYGAIPVFADVEPDYFCLDPKSVEAHITAQTKAIIVVDIFGGVYNRDAINAIAKKHNLLVIEDCAQGPGAKLGSNYAGTLADIGVYSLNYHKHIHTGEGGVLVTNNDDLADRLRLIRNHAEGVVGDKGTTNLVNMVGFNFRLTELQAAIAREQLKKLEPLVSDRVKNCDYLAKELGILPGIRFPGARPGTRQVYYFQPFLFAEKVVGVPRDLFIKAIKAELPETEGREGEGALISGGYNKPLYRLPLFEKRIAIGPSGFPWNSPQYQGTVSYNPDQFPITERLHHEELGTHDMLRPPMSRADLDDVVTAFEKVYEHRQELKNI